MSKQKHGTTEVSLKVGGKFILYKIDWTTKEENHPFAHIKGFQKRKYNKVVLSKVEAGGDQLDLSLISETLRGQLITSIHREKQLKLKL